MVLRAATAVLTVAAAGVAFRRVFPAGSVGWPVVWGVAAGAVAGVVAVGLFRRWARLPAAVVAIAIGAWVAAVVTAWHVGSVGGGAGAAVRSAGGAVVNGWSRVLTTALPVPATASRLPVVAVTLAVGAGAAVVAAVASRSAVLPLVPAAVVLTVALLLGVHGAGSPLAVVGPVLVAPALHLVVAQRAGAGRGIAGGIVSSRTLAAVAMAVVAVAVVAPLAGRLPLTHTHEPFDLRAVVNPPVDVATVASPLTTLQARLLHPGDVEFTADVDAAWLAHPSNWQQATFESYDGTGWSTTSRATRVGTTLPAGDEQGPGVATTVVLHARALSGPWVPTPGRPTGLGVADLGYDPVAQTIVDPDTAVLLPPSLTVRASLPTPSTEMLDEAGLPRSADLARLTVVPGCTPRRLIDAASKIARTVPRPDEQAVAIELLLSRQGGYHVDPQAPPGSSCGRIEQFLTDRRGTSEQFATTFALVARAAGLPTRLAVGFSPGSVDAAAGTTSVHAGDALAWPQVWLDGLGWVSFAPTPQRASTPQATQQQDRALAAIRAAQERHSLPPVPTNRPAPPAPTHRGGVSTSTVALLVVGVLLGLALLVLVAVPAVVAVRRQRRRRRPTARGRVLGAWAELLDEVSLVGVDPVALTSSEATSAVALRAPEARAHAAELAALADRAVYAPFALDVSEADSAWDELAQCRRLLRGSRTPWRRALLAIDPRRLRRRRAASPARPATSDADRVRIGGPRAERVDRTDREAVAAAGRQAGDNGAGA
jgi:transglutaminase-like putative cysteine protease